MNLHLYVLRFTFYAALGSTALALGRAPGRDPQPALRRIHARFTGQRGTFAQFGDSITVTQAFWSPLQSSCRNAPPAMEAALARVRAYLRPECWRDWKGPEYGSEGGQTVRWAHDHMAEWLKKLNPE